jgi:hypothetical protein
MWRGENLALTELGPSVVRLIASLDTNSPILASSSYTAPESIILSHF